MAWIGMQSSQNELWDYVSPFETYEYIRRTYSVVHGVARPDDAKMRQIAAAFGQGRMYLESAAQAPIGVKPVLLYYGSSALLAGLALIRDARLTQENLPAGHGVTPVRWRDILYRKEADYLHLPIKAARGTFQHIVETVWHGHIETVFLGRKRPSETAPYTHRLGKIKFAVDGSCLTFADLAARSRYTGGYYGSVTERARSLLRAMVWMNPQDGPNGLHVTIPGIRRLDRCWFVDYARNLGVDLLGPEERPYGAVFPRRDHAEDPDLLPVFHYEGSLSMSVCQSMPNGDKPSELIKLYLMAYIVGMFARYYPSQWLSVVRGTSSAPDTAVFVNAVSAIEHNILREFAAQLAVLCDDPFFFGEHFGYHAEMVAPHWSHYIGGTGTGKPIIGKGGAA